MKTLRAMLVRFVGLFRRPRHEAEMNEELRVHLDALIERNLAAGMRPDEARYAALRTFGGVAQIAERARDERRSAWGEQVCQDFRYAIRQGCKTPGFTAIVVLTLAIGIGSTTAIFTVVNAVMLRHLPVHAPSELVVVELPLPLHRLGASEPISRRLYTEFRDHAATITDVLLVGDKTHIRPFVATGLGASETDFVNVELVTGNFFTALGTVASAGRTLLSADEQSGSDAAVAVISHAFWQRRFGSDRSVIGKTVRIERSSFTLVGVAAPQFSGVSLGSSVDVWCPISAVTLLDPERAAPEDDEHLGLVMARLRSGVSREQAETELAGMFQQDLERRKKGKTTGNAGWQRYFLGRTLKLNSGAGGINLGFGLRHEFSPTLAVLGGASVILLLVACANVASLLLARSATRLREFALRAALGAGRRRLFSQLLHESLLLAVAGGVLGILFAHWGTTFFADHLPPEQNAVDLSPDPLVLAVALLVTMATGLLSGLAPAWRASRLDLVAAFKNQAMSLAGTRQRLNSLLVVIQIALAFTLLTTASLFAQTLQNLRLQDLGFSRERLLLLSVNPGKAYPGPVGAELYKRILARIETLPGVLAATLSPGTFTGNGQSGRFAIDGYTGDDASTLSANVMEVGPRFFATTGAQLVRGRDFAPQDFAPGSSMVAVVSNSFARTFFAGVDPIGRRFKQGRWTCEIIGVARDMQLESVRESTRFGIYVPFVGRIADEVRPMIFHLRTANNPIGLAPALRQLISELEPQARITGLWTMDEFIDSSLSRERVLTQFSGFFSGFALLLASLGLYGLLSYGVVRRTREIGVRVALGAQIRDVVTLVLRQGLGLVLLGSVVGIAVALAGAQLVASLLFGVSVTDASTLAGTTTTMLVIALLACWLPARRAARVDPMVALRAE